MAEKSELEEIKERIDIIDFINGFVPLKKAGRNFVGLCPFHTEKTPSFFVSPERQFYHCFGCQKSGDIFTFFMEREGLSFPEALKILAERAGVKLSARAFTPEGSQKKERLLSLSLLAAEYYYHLLLNHKVGERARDYLKKRGVTPSSIQNFKLGYAPDSWESTGKFLFSQGYSPEELIESGLGILKEKIQAPRECYDRFRARIMFPVFDILGRVVGFSGRTLKDDPKIPKYLNSPESLIFQKGRLLYGLNLTKDEIRAQNQAILVEGNLDVISVFQAGMRNVLAPLGTGFSKPQAKLIQRFTPNLIFAFDNDEAGEKATLLGLKLTLEQGLQTKIIQISQAKDPDEAVRKNLPQFKKDLKAAPDFFDYLLSVAHKKFTLAETTGKTQTANLILPFLARLPDQIAKDSYIKRLASELSVGERSIWQNLEKVEEELAKLKASETTTPASMAVKVQPRRVKSREQTLTEYLLCLLLALPKTFWQNEKLKEFLFNKISLKYLFDETYKTIFQSLVEVFIEIQEIDPQKIVARIQDPAIQKELNLLLLKTSEINLNEDKLWQSLEETRVELELTFNKKRLKRLTIGLEKLDEEKDPEKIQKLKSQIHELSRKLQR